MFSLSVSGGAARQSEVKAEGILLLRTEERKAIIIDPLPCPTVRMPRIHLQTFFWVTRYGTPILQCKDYVTLPHTDTAWGIKKVENKKKREWRTGRKSITVIYCGWSVTLWNAARPPKIRWHSADASSICSRNEVQQQCSPADCHCVSTDYASFE